jgi:SAM-dependent MidA family methyltransferase
LNPLIEIIRAEVQKNGAIPFARFMELALYCPNYGFYEREKDNIGRSGDFYTSVSAGPLFGQMLAFQFAEWRDELPIADCRLRIVEAGAHDGKLAKDILLWLRERRPKIFDALEYCIVEPSARRREWQKETLAKFENTIRWVSDVSDLENRQSAIGNRQIFTIIFSNELLDAFPVHRLGWDAKNKMWFEWGVTLDCEKLRWAKLPFTARTSHFSLLTSKELLDVLPDGFTTEISPAAENWWRAAAENLPRGKLLTFDYGLAAEEFFHPERGRGTLRAYQRHRVSDELLANPGEQDITGHVNFTSIQRVGESAGLKTDAIVSQAKFLTQVAEKIWKAPEKFGPWPAAHTRQFQTLTHPEHLGRSFRVLIQTR